MAAPMVKTKTPGVFKRGSRYVVTYRDPAGTPRKESARTYDDARALKRKRDQEVAAGEYHVHTNATFHEYAREWVER